MTISKILSGYGIDKNHKVVWDTPDVPDPTEEDVERLLLKCKTGRAIVHIGVLIDHEEEEEAGMDEPNVSVEAEDGRFLLVFDDPKEPTLSTLIESHIARDPQAADNTKDVEFINDNEYPTARVVTDFNLVLRACKEFVRTGTISPALLRVKKNDRKTWGWQ